MTAPFPYPPSHAPRPVDPPPADPGQDDPAPPDVPDGGADPSGLTAEDWSVILDAMTVITAVTQEAARRALQAEREPLDAEVRDTAQRAAEALSAAEPGREIVARLSAELAACEQRAAELVAAADDDDLSVRLDARTWRLAVEQETTALRDRLQVAARANDPHNDAVRHADHEHARAVAQLASLDKAIADPWATERGRNTDAYRVFSLRTGLWAESDGPVSRSIVDTYLRRGYGAKLQRDAIAAFQAGQVPSAGEVKHFPDGSAYIPSADGPGIHVQGRARPEDLAAARPADTSPAPSGADVMGGLRTGAGQLPAPATVTKSSSQEWKVEIPSAIRRVWR